MFGKAYLNNLYEEGTRQEIFEWLVKVDKENDEYRKQNRLIKDMFRQLDITEESDSGRIFHPITFSCCRVMMHEPFEKTLKELKESIVP